MDRRRKNEKISRGELITAIFLLITFVSVSILAVKESINKQEQVIDNICCDQSGGKVYSYPKGQIYDTLFYDLQGKVIDLRKVNCSMNITG